MVSGKVDELLKSLDTDWAFMKKQLPGRGNLRLPVLTTEQLESAAKTHIDNEFLQKLTLDEMPDALDKNYKPHDEFEAAYTSMGSSLNASIVTVLETIKTNTPRIEAYMPLTRPAWNHRKDLSVMAFEEVMMAVETANIETSSAFISLKGKMQTIGNKIKPLMGLPSNITVQISDLHKAVSAFNAQSSAKQFDKLFTLNVRKPDFTLSNDRAAGMGGLAGGHVSPLLLLQRLVVATKPDKKWRKIYWAHWLTMLDSLKLATDALLYYKELGLDLSTPGSAPSRWLWFRRGGAPAWASQAITLLDEARDELVNQLVTILMAGTAAHQAIGTEITALARPPTIVDINEINQNKTYIDKVIIKLMTLEPHLP